MPPLHWKLIGGLATVRLVTAAVVIWGVLGEGETWFGLAITLGLAMVIAAKAPGRYFLHGFLVGTLGALFEVLAMVPFAERVVANRADLREALAAFPNASPALMLLIAAPFAAPISGLLTGFIAWLVAKFLGKKTPVAAPPQPPPPPPPPAEPPPPSFTA